MPIFQRAHQNSSSPKQAEFVAKALSYQGHRAMANLVSGFGERVGYGSQPWAGSFIDVVAREVGLNLPALVYTPNALAEFMQAKRIVTKPQPGDIVFYSFAGEGAGSPFEMPHVGIVTEVQHLTSTGQFRAVEGQTATGLPKGNQDASGVYVRTRHLNEVLAFARPDYKRTLSFNNMLNLSGQLPLVTVPHLTTGKPNRTVEVLQRALRALTDLTGHTPGRMDVATRTGLARYQRRIGRVGKDAAGNPDTSTLTRLAADSNLFRAE